MRRLAVVLFLGAFFYLAFFFQLGRVPFIGPDEPRYARIAEEMNLRGNYVTPTLQFHPWLEKPPLLYWVDAASYRVFGVSEWSARLPVAILALATVLAMAAFAWKRGPRLSLLTALALGTCLIFVVFARAAVTDMPLTCCFTLGMIFGYVALESGGIAPALASGLAFGLATLAKGPVALILPLGIFAAFLVLRPEKSCRWLQILVWLTGVLVVATPWYYRVWLENGYAFISIFWLNQNLARFVTTIHHHARPFWYFLWILFAGAFPWTVFLFSAIARISKQRWRWVRESDALELYLWLWVVIPTVFFSVSESKLPGYILPVIPALATLAAIEWGRYLENDSTVVRWMTVEVWVAAGFSLVFALMILHGCWVRYDAPALGVLLAASLTFGAAGLLYAFYRRKPRWMFLALATAVLALSALAYWRGTILIDGYNSTRELSRMALAYISPDRPLVFYRYFHHTAAYYTSYQTTHDSFERVPDLCRYLEEHPQTSYLVLTQEAGYPDLKRAFDIRLLRHQGILYLLELRSAPARPGERGPCAQRD